MQINNYSLTYTYIFECVIEFIYDGGCLNAICYVYNWGWGGGNKIVTKYPPPFFLSQQVEVKGIYNAAYNTSTDFYTISPH